MGIGRIGKTSGSNIAGGRGGFSAAVLDAIEQAIKAGETTHAGQVRFVVEGALDGPPLFTISRRANARWTFSRNCGSGIPRTTTAC